MTVREVIAKRKRMASIVAYSGLALFLLGMLLGAGEPPWLFLAIPGFAVFFAGTLYLLLFLRCPSCRGAIGYTVSHLSGPFSISRKIQFCPFCGIALDAELADKKGV
jgi:hypothetical protein